LHEKKELIIAACLHPKLKSNWLTGNKKKIASYLEDLLGIRSSENYPNDKQQTVVSNDDFFNFL